MILRNELSRREREVVALLLEGQTNKQIALGLHISERTVEFHLKNIYAKYQVASRVELVLKLGTSTVESVGQLAQDRDPPGERTWAALAREAVSKFGQEIKMQGALGSTAGVSGRAPTFFKAIRVCLVKYADFTGRASRPEFWWFALFVTLGAGALLYVHEAAAGVFGVAMLLPFLAAGARRARDAGRSGWWQLFYLAPAAGLVIVASVLALPSVSAPDDAPAA
ncbi:MAG: DUF805 domain-containing protein [Anaerolineales bacterium]|nr:DUF805 domain-containing protein [Anaerolineales bacterium]